MKLRNVNWRLEPHTPRYAPILQVPDIALPVLAGGKQESAIARPTQRLDLACMSFQLPCDAVCLDVENNHCPVNASRCKEIALAIEADARRMAAAKTACRRFWIVLCEDKRIYEREIHCVDGVVV